MKIIEKLVSKTKDHMNHEGVTIAFLGDSVTQGCFEIYKKENNQIETVFDKRYSYEHGVFDILCTFFPMATVNIINAGISGDRSVRGVARLERDVLRHQPDLTVVCYGLNDCSRKEESIGIYTKALREIFEKVLNSGSELIFMTPNMMNTKISPHLQDDDFIKIARNCAELQNNGRFDAHIEAARSLCQEMHVPICDCYAIWKKLSDGGVDTTELLANKINHPTREMNKLFAYELVRTMFSA
ncbi:MAG: GDSL family lipase [Clostridia bacterium]|nr:GDSL family lipase [Clostridia bacterium]